MLERKRFLLRVDPQLYSALEKWAADDLRSVNAQIEFVLSEALRRSGRSKGPSAGSDEMSASEDGTDGPAEDS
ncbi:MAG TPA: hypothetical protein VFN03_08825 [Trueperaceae bacterium]|nr:hypothetical protein [Trueperaceae bacterium]